MATKDTERMKWVFKTIIKAMEDEDSTLLARVPGIRDLSDRLDFLVSVNSRPEDWPTAGFEDVAGRADTDHPKQWQKNLVAALLNNPNEDNWIILLQEENAIFGPRSGHVCVAKPLSDGSNFHTYDEYEEFSRCFDEWKEATGSCEDEWDHDEDLY